MVGINHENISVPMGGLPQNGCYGNQLEHSPRLVRQLIPLIRSKPSASSTASVLRQDLFDRKLRALSEKCPVQGGRRVGGVRQRVHHDPTTDL